MSTILVLLVLAVIVGLVIRKMIADRKAGKSCCGSGCAQCGLCSGKGKDETGRI